MAGAETAKMVASLDLKDNLSKGLQTAGKNIDGFSRKLASSRAVAVGLGVGLEHIAAKGLSALGDAIGDGIRGAQELERTTAQTEAVITSTGGAAGVTAQQIRDLANAQEDLTTADDKAVQQGENLLLTFTNIGGQVFPQATAAMVNMAIAMNKGDASTADFDATAIQLGKALNDPVKGLTALSKVGVSFTAAQADQIKKLAGTGNALKDLQTAHIALTKDQAKFVKGLGGSVGPLTAARKAGVKLTDQQVKMLKAIEDGSGTIEAQKIILAELEKEFGKAGTAAGTGFTADVNRANDAIDDAKVAIAQGLIPAVGEVARELSTTLKDPQVLAGLKNLGTDIGKGISGAVAFAKSIPWDKVGQGLSIAAEAAKTVVSAFTSLPPWVQAAVISGWGLNKITGGLVGDLFSSLASGLIKGVLGITAGVVQVNAASVTGVSGAANLAETAAATVAGISLATVAVIAAAAAGSVFAFVNLHTGQDSPGAFTPTVGAAFDNKPVSSNDFTGIDWGSVARDLDHSAGALEATARMRDTETSQSIDALTAALTAPGKLAGGAQRDAETSAAIATAVQSSLGTVADGILTAASQRDKETSDAISLLATTSDVTSLKDAVTQGILGNLVPSVDIGAHNTSVAATQAGQAAARQTFASGLGIEGAIRASQPITNVKVEISATNVTSVQVVADRGGERNGSRDGDGGGGPGQ